MPYVKLDAKILTSTIWFRTPEREVFLTALLMAEPYEVTQPTPTLQIDSLEDGGFVVPVGWYGFVGAAAPGILNRANIGDAAAGIAALKSLASPEPDSRSQEYEGRRMVRINGGYLLLNFMKYRDKDHTAAMRMQRLRDRRKAERAGVSLRNERHETPNVTEDRGQRTEDIKKDKASGAEAPSPSLPFSGEALLAAWDAFKTHRAQSRTKLTQAATKAALAKLARMGEARAVAALRHSLENGYQGIFEPDGAVAASGSVEPLKPIPEPEGWRGRIRSVWPEATILENDTPWTEMTRGQKTEVVQLLKKIR